MGLNISHGTWHGAYSAFMRWRVEIARCIGVPLEFMEGFYSNDANSSGPALTLRVLADAEVRSNPSGTYRAADSLKRSFEVFPIPWSILRPDPLHALLHHSDCDGHLTPTQAAKIADRLAEIMPLIKDEDGNGHVGNFRVKTQTFIDGCRRAASANERLRFS